MSGIMAWLPDPSADQITALRAKDIAPDQDLPGLWHLSKAEWDGSDLRRIAKRLRATLETEAGQAAAKKLNIPTVRLLIFSNASADHLSETITGTSLRHGMAVQTMVVEYEEPEAYLARAKADVDAFAPDCVLLHYNGDGFSVREAPGAGPEATAAVADPALRRLQAMRAAIVGALGKPVILQTLAKDPSHSLHHADALIHGSEGEAVRAFNRGLADWARTTGDLVLDVAGMAESVGLRHWHSARYWAMAKYPFAPQMAPYFAEHLCRLIALQRGKSKRVLVLDLDNTVWGGIVGDDGKENLAIGPGSPAGEAHAAIQSMAKALTRRGIILALSSKNEESIALDAFSTHPEMILGLDDIAAHEINWTDKAANIVKLSKTLSLGLDAFVFLDDNPAERKRVREALPDVAVPEVPKDITEWLPVVQDARYFETAGFSEEDAKRTGFYQANAQRAALVDQFTDHDDYLKSLQMVMDVRPFDALGRKRIAQLIAKSNQFNLTTLRRSETEVAALERDPVYQTMQIRLADTFGDNGMIAVIVAEAKADALDIDTWLMSCRVLGRGVEQRILDVLVGRAKALGKSAVTGTYIPTAKNIIVKDHYAALGFTPAEAATDGDATHWILPVSGYTPSSAHIDVTSAEDEADTDLSGQEKEAVA